MVFVTNSNFWDSFVTRSTQSKPLSEPTAASVAKPTSAAKKIATNDVDALLKKAQTKSHDTTPTKKLQTITKIVAQKKSGRYNLFLDGKFALGVSESVIVSLRLHKGQTLTKKECEHIVQAETNAKAYSDALDYLSYSLRTTKEVRQKLADKNVTPAVIDAVINKLTAQRLLDDLQYAKSFIKTQMNTSDKGPYIIISKLRQKGVGEHAIQTALELYDGSSQVKLATRLAEKYYRRYHKHAATIQKQKVQKALLTKGFSSDIAATACANAAPAVSVATETKKLAAAATKAVRRYQKYEFKIARQKLTACLLRKGFNYSDINAWLDDNDDWHE